MIVEWCRGMGTGVGWYREKGRRCGDRVKGGGGSGED